MDTKGGNMEFYTPGRTQERKRVFKIEKPEKVGFWKRIFKFIKRLLIHA